MESNSLIEYTIVQPTKPSRSAVRTSSFQSFFVLRDSVLAARPQRDRPTQARMNVVSSSPGHTQRSNQPEYLADICTRRHDGSLEISAAIQVHDRSRRVLASPMHFTLLTSSTAVGVIRSHTPSIESLNSITPPHPRSSPIPLRDHSFVDSYRCVLGDPTG